MANTRMITSDIWEDEFFTSLTILERLIWIGLITNCADDQGRFQDNVHLIASRIFPMEEIDKNDIEQALAKFASLGKLCRYVSHGKKLAQIVNWWKHQRPRWAGKSNYPPPVGWVDRERYHLDAKTIYDVNWDKNGGFMDDYINSYISDYIESSTPADVNGDVNGDNDVDIDNDSEVEVDNAQARKETAAAAIAEVSKIYESEIGVITPIVRDKIIDALDNYSVEWIVEAVKEAVRSNVRNWAYVSAILQSWKERGFKAKKDLEPNANRIDDFRKLFAEQKKKMNGEKS